MAVSAAVLVSELSKLGITLYREEDRLKYKAPPGALTQELLLEIRHNKDALLAFLPQGKPAESAVSPIVRRPVKPGDPIPLSSAQQAFWFRDRLMPGNPAYNVATAFRLRGKLDPEAFDQAIAFLVDRHDSLRTVFGTVNDLPVQIVRAGIETPLSVFDLRNVPENNREAAGRAKVTSEAQWMFNLETGPLFRAAVVLMGERESLLLFCMHHIISDRWSLRLLLQEFMAAYQAFASGQVPQVAPLLLQYSDYAFWQRELLQSGVYRKQMEYWKTRLANAPGVLELPLDSPRPAIQSHRGARRNFRLPKALSAGLAAIANEFDASMFMACVAAFKVLLHRYSGEEDICIGCPVADRSLAALEPLVGLFLNTVVLRTSLSGDPAFSSLLAQVGENTLEAYEKQDVPFERLVEELQPERDSSHFPLFQVMVVFQNRWPESAAFSGIEVETLELSTQATMFDLTLSLAEESDESVSGFFRYNADLFTDITIRRMIADFTTLLEGVVVNPHSPISQLPMLTDDDLKALAPRRMVEIDLPFTEFPAAAMEMSMPECFRRQVERSPRGTAVVSGSETWTYEELNSAANGIAAEILRRQSANASGGRIGLMLDHRGTAVAAMLGVLKAASVYVPLEPSYPVERLRHILRDAKISLVLVSRHAAERAREAANGACEVVDVESLSAAGAGEIMLPVSAHDVACLLYTSGSTGRPKGAVQTHRHILHVIRNYTNRLHISESDRLSLVASFVHVASLPDIYAALLNGAAVHLYDVRNEGIERLPDWLRESGITIYHSVPTLYRLLLDFGPQTGVLEGIRAVVLGGEEVFARDVEAYQRRFGPDCVFVNMYGSTESTVTTMGVLNQASKIERDPVPVGVPVGSNEVILLGSCGKPTRVVGEIAVSSPYLPASHWNRDGSESPFYIDAGGRCVYRTGDYGRLLTDGNLVLLGRKDFQVKIRGFRVELGEIEAVVSQYPGVSQAIVVARKDILGNKRLAGYVVSIDKTAPVDFKNLRNHLRHSLPAYMVPDLLVPLEDIPYTTTGKIDRNNLPAPDWSRVGSGGEHVDPRNDMERRIAAIWREVLKIGAVGIHDNFFDLGGHSLLAIQILERIRRDFQVALPINELFGTPTIAGIAEALEARQKSAAEPPADPPLVPVARRRRTSTLEV